MREPPAASAHVQEELLAQAGAERDELAGRYRAVSERVSVCRDAWQPEGGSLARGDGWIRQRVSGRGMTVVGHGTAGPWAVAREAEAGVDR